MKMEGQVQRNLLRFWALLPEDLGTDTTKLLDLLKPFTCGRKHRYKDLRDVDSFQTDLEVKRLCSTFCIENLLLSPESQHCLMHYLIRYIKQPLFSGLNWWCVRMCKYITSRSDCLTPPINAGSLKCIFKIFRTLYISLNLKHNFKRFV
jgi:hypothetical protein